MTDVLLYTHTLFLSLGPTYVDYSMNIYIYNVAIIKINTVKTKCD